MNQNIRFKGGGFRLYRFSEAEKNKTIKKNQKKGTRQSKRTYKDEKQF